MTLACEHGQLARACEICRLEADIADAERRTESWQRLNTIYLKERDEARGDAEREYGLRCVAGKERDVMHKRAEAAEATAAKYREALEWYGQKAFYHMTSFRTAAPLQDLNAEPRNIDVQGSPIMHDTGRRARQALAKEGSDETLR